MAGGAHEVVRETRDGFEGVVLAAREAGVRAAFAPGAGMVGYSLTHRGDELLGQLGGLAAYAERGSSFGIPLLHPWANRLDAELDPAAPVRRDEHGLPIHGLLVASPHWELLGTTVGDGEVSLAARLDFGSHPELLAGFPYPHEVHVHATLAGATLTIVTIVLPTGERTVPIAFGWHPYLTLPGAPREEWRIELPVRRRGLLDERGIPTGETEPADLPPAPLGERVFDDLFVELAERPVFAAEGDGRRLEVAFDPGYPVAQVYAPEGSDFICFEPMTAPTNALVSGRGLRAVAPGESFTAGFSVTALGA